ncbi:MAG: NADP-dependent oxidoreductase [Anaerolineae bacterium]
MSATLNRQWCLVARPVGPVKESDLELRTEPIPALNEGQVLIHNLYLSLDPTYRGWMDAGGSYIRPIPLGAVMRGMTVGVVAQSRNSHLPEGTHVCGTLGWEDYTLSDGKGLALLPDDPSIPLTAYLSLLGHIGLSAYFGLLDIGKPVPGETLVVSAAAGAVGSLVGQIGKIKGCRVVGIAGSDEKCRWLTDELGFDAALNYKTEPVYETLKKHCPNGIDIHFENVGGEILEAALSLLNLRARVVLCGLIAQYNATRAAPGPRNLGNLIGKRARIEGFLVLDYLGRAMEALPDLQRWHAEGKLRYRVDVVDDLENAVKAFNRLFDGSNTGKLIVKF